MLFLYWKIWINKTIFNNNIESLNRIKLLGYKRPKINLNKKNIDKIQINNYNLFDNNKSQKNQYFTIDKTIKDEAYKYHIYDGDKIMILRKEKPENKFIFVIEC